MSRILLAGSTIIACFTIAGCSDNHQETVDYKPNTDLEKPKGRGKDAYVSGTDDFARRLEAERAKVKAKAGKK